MSGRIRSKKHKYGGEFVGQRSFPSGTFSTPVFYGSHTCIDATHPGPPYKRGGSFFVSKRTVKYNLSAHCSAWKTSLPDARYEGKFYASAPTHDPQPGPTNLSPWGAIGWNKTLPVRPIADLGTAIGELKDFPGMIKQTADFLGRLGRVPFGKKGTTLGDFRRDITAGPRNLGSDYLNLQFGWVPFVSDILSIINARENLKKRLSQLKKDNGMSVRRRAELDNHSSSSGSEGGSTFTSLSPTLETGLYATGDSLANRSFTTTSYERHIWYSAKYVYHIPSLDFDEPGQGLANLNGLERRLLGLELTANTLYNLTPWSWLADWFTSAGAVVQNAVLNNQYHVVAAHAYVMCTDKYTKTKYGTCNIRTGKWGSVSSAKPQRFFASTSEEILYKQRAVANPYGFGVTDASLSGYQWSILAALGLGRIR